MGVFFSLVCINLIRHKLLWTPLLFSLSTAFLVFQLVLFYRFLWLFDFAVALDFCILQRCFTLEDVDTTTSCFLIISCLSPCLLRSVPWRYFPSCLWVFQLITDVCVRHSSWLWFYIYIMPAWILHPVFIYWTVLGASLQSLHLGPWLVWKTPASVPFIRCSDLPFRAFFHSSLF